VWLRTIMVYMAWSLVASDSMVCSLLAQRIDQALQGRDVAAREPLYRRGVVQLRAVDPVDAQLVPGDQADDLDQVGPLALRILLQPGRAIRQPEQPRFPGDLVRLPQVVEADLRLGARTQPLGDLRVLAQVAQNPVPDAAVGDLLELLVDRMQLGSL